MGRTARDRREHLPRPVQKIELNARHMKMRLALALLLFIGGIGLIFYSIFSGSSVPAGWAEIAANPGEVSCAADFTFLYPLGTNDAPAAESRALTALYTEACVNAYRIFTNDTVFDDVRNVCFLNGHPNEETEVDAALYAALEQTAASGDRSLYLAPLYEVYDGIFHCDDPSATVYFDPRQNRDLREWFAKVCVYAADPSQADIELLGNGRVRLKVSEEYLAFAQQEEIGSFIDFYWMKNAFIADYLAGRLTAGGYHIGTLSSFDGFSRNLDTSGETDYSIGIYEREGGTIRTAAVLHYQGARSFVSLRSYPLNEAAGRYYSVLSDGAIRTPYLDVRDGLCKSAVNDLAAYSENAGCADILLKLVPVYITEEFQPSLLDGLAREGVQSIYSRDGTLCCTEESAELVKE